MRWNDDRLDDLREGVEKLEERINANGTVTAANNLKLIEIDRELTMKRDHRWTLLVAVITIVLSQVGTTIVTVTRNSQPQPKPQPIIVQIHK